MSKKEAPVDIGSQSELFDQFRERGVSKYLEARKMLQDVDPVCAQEDEVGAYKQAVEKLMKACLDFDAACHLAKMNWREGDTDG